MFALSNSGVWDVFSASLLITLCGLLTLHLSRLLGVHQLWALFLYAWHLSLTFFFFYVSSGGGVDAANYYIASLEPLSTFKPGTQAVIHITMLFSRGLHFSYLSTSLVFSFLGFAALLIFSSIIFEITCDKVRLSQRVAVAFLLMPGLHFWHSGIGKDVFTLLGAAFVCLAVFRSSRIWVLVTTGIALAFIVRPHIAVLLIIGVFVYLAVSSRVSLVSRILLFAATTIIGLAAFQFLLSYLGFEDNFSAGGVNDYIEGRQNYNTDGSLSLDISSMSVFLRLFVYLFRPFPFEAPGIMGLVVGFESIFLLLVFIYFLPRVFWGSKNIRMDFRLFLLFIGLLCLFVFANTTANLGIALRQKWMFVPFLFIYLISSTKRAR